MNILETQHRKRTDDIETDDKEYIGNTMLHTKRILKV